MKRHLAVLDGLRGTAALLVVVFHLLEAYFHTYELNPLRHAYLAVGFFFLLSGYVVGYAYDDRLSSLRVSDFLRIRLVRLHPLVVAGAVLGALCYYYDPFAGQLQFVSGRHLLANMLFGALLLPFAALPNTYNQIYPLNGPSWSLLQEYLANIAYVLLAPRLGQRALQVLAAVSAVALIAAALAHGNLHGNWGWDNFWMGPVRLVFPFTMGLLLFRQRISLRVPRAFWVLSLVLLAVFAGLSFQPAGLYEALCVIVVLVAAGAGAAPSRGSPLPSAAGAAGSRIRCTCCTTRLLRFSLTGCAQRTPHWLSLS